jgi:hypothetical protein
MLFETMEQAVTPDLDLQSNPIGNERTIILAGCLGNNAAKPPGLSLSNYYEIGDDGFIALVSALE